MVACASAVREMLVNVDGVEDCEVEKGADGAPSGRVVCKVKPGTDAATLTGAVKGRYEATVKQ